MPDTLVDRVSIPAIISGVSVAFQPLGMIADKVSPRIPVTLRSGKYRIFGKNEMIVRDAAWAAGSIPNQLQSRWSLDTYYAEIYKLRHPLLDAELANNAPAAFGGMDLRTEYTQATTMAIAIAREARVAGIFTNPANYPASNIIAKAVGTEYDQPNMGGEQVFTDINNLLGLTADATLHPISDLSLVIPELVWRRAIKRNTAMLDAIKYSQLGIMTEQLLAELLGVEEVILGQSVTAGAGPEVAGSDVITGYPTTYLWGDTIWAGLIGDESNIRMPSFSRSFNWTTETGGQIRQTREYRMADEGQEGTWIEVKEAIAEKIVFAGGGAIITNALSTV